MSRSPGLFGLTKKDHARTRNVVRQVERGGPGPGRRKRTIQSSAVGAKFIAKVDSDATGGGYYNCHIQILDATDWDTTTADQLDDTGDSVVVLNLVEEGTAIHNLDAGDLIIGHSEKDDAGNVRLVGNEVFGKHTFGEW